MSRQVAVGIIESAFGAKIDYGLRGIRRAGRGRLDRAGPSRLGHDRGRPARGRGQGAARRAWRGASRRDLTDMFFAARFAERIAPELRRLRLVQVVDTLARSVRMEMDFRLEAAAASEFAENSKDDPDIRAPAIDWDRTTREVMTMEWMDGHPLTDPERLEALGFDPRGWRGRSSSPFSATRCAMASSTPTCIRAISSSTRRAALSRSISASWAGSGERSGGSSPRSSTASSAATIAASPKSISRPAMCRTFIASRISPRRSGRSANRSTPAPPTRSRWRGC